MRILYMGFAVPQHLFERVLETDRSLPTQTQQFGWSVVRSLRVGGATAVDIVSAEPVQDYPHNTRKYVRGEPFSEDGIRGVTISFVNVVGVKHLSRFVTAMRSVRTLRKGGSYDLLLVHGVHSPFLWAGIFASRKWRVPAVTILTDAPSLRTTFDSTLSSVLKRLDLRLVRSALARMDGVVSLSPTLSSRFAPGVPALQLEGISREFPPLEPEARESDLRVVYAGTLDPGYGVEELLDATALAGARWHLEIYGRGAAVSSILRAEASGVRVRYRGSVPPDEMPRVYAETDVLVNPRPPHSVLAEESFPSKLIEYLATGLPVVSTGLPHIPDDMASHLVIAESGARGLAEAIDAVVKMTADERQRLGSAARDFVRESRGERAQGLRLLAFFRQLAKVGRAGPKAKPDPRP